MNDIAGLLLAFIFTVVPQKYTPLISTVLPEATSQVVTHVYDGDTIKLGNGEKVRYIGIDTPEVKNGKKNAQCFAMSALEENKKLVLYKKVELVKDVSDTDKYGRLLRYVYVDDGKGKKIEVNKHLVREGYAKVMTIAPDISHSKKYTQYMKEARQDNRGLWGSCY